MQDVNLILRDTLKSFMNSNGFTDLLKARWVYQRKIADAANGIQIEEKELDSVSHKEFIFKQNRKFYKNNYKNNF
jgi:hypothetical protein